MHIIDKLAWIEIQNQKILMTRSKNKDKFYIPGGKREPGESDHQALIREIKEELSVDLLEESLQFYGIFEAQAHGQPEGILVKMQCYTGQYSGILSPASEIEEIQWLNYADKDQTGYVDQLIFEKLKTSALIV